MKRIFSKKEKAENEVKVKKRFLNKKIYIAIMLILILLLISILMFVRSNGIKNFGDIKNFINNKLNSEEPQQASDFSKKDWSEVKVSDDKELVVNPKYSYGTIFKVDANSKIKYKKDDGDFNKEGDVEIVENSDTNMVFGATKKGAIKFKITRCAVDEDGDICDVIVTVSTPKGFEEQLPDYVRDHPQTFHPATSAFGNQESGGRDWIKGGDKTEKADRFRNVVKVRLDPDEDTNLYRISFATLFSHSDFTVQYVKNKNNDKKAEIKNIFCIIDDMDISPKSDSSALAHIGDGPFDGNEGIMIPQSLGGSRKVIYAQDKNCVKVKENYSYKGNEYNAVYRNDEINLPWGEGNEPRNEKEKWYIKSGIMLNDLEETSDKGKFKIHYSGTTCGINMLFNAPYVYDLPTPPQKRIWPGGEGRPEGMGSDKIITPKKKNTVKEGETFRYAIRQYLPNCRAVKKVNGNWSLIDKPYTKFVLYDKLGSELEVVGGKNNIKIRDETGEDVTGKFTIEYDNNIVTAKAKDGSLENKNFYGHSYTLIIPVKVKEGTIQEGEEQYGPIINGGNEGNVVNETSSRYKLWTRR